MIAKGHAEMALEHLISALRDENIVIHTYSQGTGAPAGLSYNIGTGQRCVAQCTVDNGLNVYGYNAVISARVRDLIAAHCPLYYALHPTRG